MYKATYKDVKDLQRWGIEEPEVSKLMENQSQPRIHEIAYFAPSTANWTWRIGLARIDGETYELLTRFGVVEGGRKVYLSNL